MNIVDWFDPDNLDHVKAYAFLHDKGCWPQDFVPAEVEFDSIWMIRLYEKITNHWISYMLQKDFDNKIDIDDEK